MDATQFAHWKQLSLGLARTYQNLTPRRKAKLLEEVENCIEWVVCNGLDTIGDWDNGVKIDGRYGHDSVGTRVDEYLWESRYEIERKYGRRGRVELVTGRFGQMLSACVRAGFDVAVAPSGGVIGFTVGDLRSIFDGALPDWVSNFFVPPVDAATPDAEGVWL